MKYPLLSRLTETGESPRENPLGELRPLKKLLAGLLPDLGVDQPNGTLVLPPDDGGWTTDIEPLGFFMPEVEPMLPEGVWPVGVLRPNDGTMNVGRFDPAEGAPLPLDAPGNGTFTPPVRLDPTPEGAGPTGVFLPNNGGENVVPEDLELQLLKVGDEPEPGDPEMVGFGVEGARIPKRGVIVVLREPENDGLDEPLTLGVENLGVAVLGRTKELRLRDEELNVGVDLLERAELKLGREK